MRLVIQRLKPKGFFSIEAVISLAFALFVILTAIGWYTYMLPRQNLEKQIHILAQKAKIQGGLTATTALLRADTYNYLSDEDKETDLGFFLDTLQQMGHDISKVQVTCQTAEGKSGCLGVTPYREDGVGYIRRQDMDMMVIHVVVPTKPSLLSMSYAFFGSSGSVPSQYIFEEVVMSERW